MANVLFVCIGNQGRSLMAERLFQRAAAGRHDARSAGSFPGSTPHAEVVTALAELGIDARDHVPHRLEDADLAWADVVVAACDGACPVTPGKQRIDWHLEDPMGRPPAEVRVIRDDIAQRVEALVDELEAGS